MGCLEEGGFTVGVGEVGWGEEGVWGVSASGEGGGVEGRFGEGEGVDFYSDLWGEEEKGGMELGVRVWW